MIKKLVFIFLKIIILFLGEGVPKKNNKLHKENLVFVK